MGVLTPKRVALFFVAVLLGTSAFAKNPSPRTLARMAWDVPNGVGVLFGGRGPFDGATGVPHSSDETWVWNGSRWLERFPTTKPPARSAQSMVFDSARGRVVMFGGRVEPNEADGVFTNLNDTWFWKNDNWTKIETANAPSPRHVAGMAYDSDRDRIVLYGGNDLAADNETVQQNYETWEFDGSNWTKVAADNPKVFKPLLAYDAARKQVVMMGLEGTALTRVMYGYDSVSKTWSQYPTSTTMPTCVNEGHFVYQQHRGRLAFVGGICTSNTPEAEEIFEFDGTNWVKVTGNTVSRALGQASAYDPLRGQIVTFGGTLTFSTVLSSITSIAFNGQWTQPVTTVKPSPRSLAAFTTDPANSTIWLFGGLDEDSSFFFGDFWGYRNGQWFLSSLTDAPGGGCETPLSAFDTDRNVLVVTCAGTETWEWDGTKWTAMNPANDPPTRRYAAMVYDAKLKKTLIFGGYNQSNYRNDTWSWDGKNWTEIKVDSDKRPNNRGLMAMWYDPLQQKTILYGGLGRKSVNETISRYSDMWAFDGSRWTKLSVSTTPGPRFGPQYAVDPNTGKVLLFGGLRSENIDEDSLRQFYSNDTWQWNGSSSTWTKLEPTRVPNVRENGSMAWDPIAQRLVMFAGYADGFYRSDVWYWTGTDWEPFVETGGRRRAVR